MVHALSDGGKKILNQMHNTICSLYIFCNHRNTICCHQLQVEDDTSILKKCININEYIINMDHDCNLQNTTLDLNTVKLG